MKKQLCVLLIACALLSATWSQANDNKTPQIDSRALTHSDVFWTGAIPYLATYAGVSARGILPAEYGDHIFSLIVLTGNIPHCMIDPLNGAKDTLISAGAYSAGFILDDYPQLYGNQSMANTLKTIGLNTSFWSYYQGYSKARSMATAGSYTEPYKTYSFEQLYFAPYNTTTLRQPSVWIPTAICSLGLLGMYYMDSGFNDSVFATGKAYIGNTEIPVLLGLFSTIALSCVTYGFTGVGEEALFRGVGYEEMKVSFGVVPAKLVDSLGFSACHIPNDIKKGYGFSTIALDYCVKSLVTLGLQWAYDDGGLEYSVAQHMWIDVMSSTLLYLCYAGNGDNDVTLSLNVTFPL